MPPSKRGRSGPSASAKDTVDDGRLAQLSKKQLVALVKNTCDEVKVKKQLPKMLDDMRPETMARALSNIYDLLTTEVEELTACIREDWHDGYEEHNGRFCEAVDVMHQCVTLAFMAAALEGGWNRTVDACYDISQGWEGLKESFSNSRCDLGDSLGVLDSDAHFPPDAKLSKEQFGEDAAVLMAWQEDKKCHYFPWSGSRTQGCGVRQQLLAVWLWGIFGGPKRAAKDTADRVRLVREQGFSPDAMQEALKVAGLEAKASLLQAALKKVGTIKLAEPFRITASCAAGGRRSWSDVESELEREDDEFEEGEEEEEEDEDGR